jgi:signal transduction histidine kinase
LKSDFLSRAAHDLRTPLTSIAWAARNLLDGVAGPVAAPQTEYLESIRASADQLARLVANLVEVSRLEAGVLKIEIVPVDLLAVLREAFRALAPLTEERHLGFDLEAGEHPVLVRGDRGRLTQVAINLLDNALKYSPDDSRVEVTVEDAEGMVRLEIRDHGPGIAPKELEEVFVRFHQGTPSPYAARPGLGVGLYVVRSITELLGGHVRATNHAAGGAVFTCELPAWNDTGKEE